MRKLVHMFTHIRIMRHTLISKNKWQQNYSKFQTFVQILIIFISEFRTQASRVLKLSSRIFINIKYLRLKMTSFNHFKTTSTFEIQFSLFPTIVLKTFRQIITTYINILNKTRIFSKLISSTLVKHDKRTIN